MKHGVLFLQDNAVTHHHHDVHSLLHAWGCKVLAHPHFLDLCDYFCLLG